MLVIKKFVALALGSLYINIWFEMADKSISIVAENIQIFKPSIHNTDMASEMVGYTRNQILSQAGTAILAQANVQMQSVLQLLD